MQEHLRTDDNGTTWIYKPREKTAVMSCILLLPHLLALQKKYEQDSELRTTRKLLPVPSNQKMDAYLKEIADLCNIPKNLTTHVARHTFACLAVEYGMPIDVLAKILGHSNIGRYFRFAAQNKLAHPIIYLFLRCFDKPRAEPNGARALPRQEKSA